MRSWRRRRSCSCASTQRDARRGYASNGRRAWWSGRARVWLRQLQVFAQGGRVIEARFLRSVENRDRPVAQVSTQLRDTGWIGVELGEVAAPKLVPLRGVVLIPAPQLVGGGERLGPEVALHRGLGQAA